MSNPLSTVVIQISQTTASLVPSAATGSLNMYANLTDHLIYVKNSSGTSTAVGGGGGGSGSVSSISAGANMSFSTITTTGSIALASTLTGTTLTTPVINGATASSGNFDFSGSSGTFKTPTGAATFGNSSYIFNAAWTAQGWSMVNYCNANGGSLVSAGSYTVGQRWWFTQAVSITGIRTYWAGGAGAKTLKLQVWNPSSGSAASTTVAVNAAGIYTVSITPVTVSAANTYKNWTFSSWENSGASYTNTSTAACVPGGLGSDKSFMANPYAFPQYVGLYDSGDVIPASSNATQYMPVEPIYTVT